MKKIISVFLMFLMIIPVFSGCNISKNQEGTENTTASSDVQTTENVAYENIEETQEYYFPHSLTAMAGRSAKKLASELEETGQVEKIVVNDEGTDHDSITMYITEEQKEFWIESRKDLLDKLSKDMSAFKPEYHAEYNEDCTEVSLYCDPDLSVHNAAEFFYISQFFCGMYQILNGTYGDNWNVDVFVYNSQTGKLVKSGDTWSGMGYEEEDWLQSY